MAVTGAIADATRNVMPTTWDMLSQEPQFGDVSLRSVIDTKKEEVFGTAGTPDDEEFLPLIVVRYMGKLVALELISPAMDAWRNKPVTVTTTGTNEVESFTDAIETLQTLRKNLLEQTRAEWGLVAPLIDFRRITNSARPALNTIDDDFLTPSPQEFPRPYKVTDRT